jgi:hypothetical protein
MSAPSSAAARPAAEVTLLRALELAVQRRASPEQLLYLVRRSGWALVRRTAPVDEEVWDLVRTVALSAAYRSDDIFEACYGAVIEQAEHTLERHLAIVGRLHAVPAGDEVPA